MRWQQELSFILRRLIYRRHAERELDDEIRAHLEMEIEQNIADGLSPEEARLAARRSFGSVALAKENSRVMWGFGSLEILWQDLRYGLRMLLRNPGFTVVAVITLSLGIAANTTIFSLADALVLRPFDFPHQDRLVFVWEPKPQAEMERGDVAPGNFVDWREHSQSFERLVALIRRPFNLTGIDQPERLSGFQVSAGFFDALGVKAALGRAFLPGEDEAGRNQVVVLTARLWQRSFGGDPNVVGRTIQLNAEAFVVIGVLPADFNFPGEIWTPLVLDEQAKLDRADHYLGVIGLLKPGIGVAQADADLDMISQRAQRLFPETNAGRTAGVMAMNEYILSDAAKESVLVLTGVVALVLLIACANVANLLIGRALARRKEIAVRLALGASRWRLIRQMLTESMLLAFAGGVVGLLLSVLAVDLLRRGMPEDIAKIIVGFDHFAVNRAALLLTLLVSGLSSLLFGLAPAWQATRPNPNEIMKEGARGALSAGSSHRLRGALVVSEVALSLVLLIGAGLMIRSFVAMLNDDLGFNPHNALGLYISLSEEKYPAEKRRIFYDQLLRRLETLPGVAAVGATSKLPLSVDGDLHTEFALVGEPPFEKGKEPVANYRIVSPGYFGVIGMPLKRGRDFTARDDERAVGVVVVNEAFARRFFSNREVIGQRITTAGRTDKPQEIIGVVGDVIDDDFSPVAPPYLYAAYAQDSRTEMGIVVRTAGEPTSIAAAVRKEVTNLDPTQPVFYFKTIERIAHEWNAPERIMTVMMSVFAGIALLMAVVGLYAVMAYAVLQRTHEIGVRLALGAQARNILRLIAGQGLKLTLIGLALGLAGALALTRVMSPLLYRVSAVDPTTFILISLLLLCVALLACWLPARRATKVDPMIALRGE
jgi:putative ABC transport system permease protein